MNIIKPCRLELDPRMCHLASYSFKSKQALLCVHVYLIVNEQFTHALQIFCCTLMQDVIPEVMQWKQFPNHYLIASENHRRLASVWKPRWSDPFSSDLLPAQANGASELQLLTGPQPDDFVDPEWYV